nr:DUF6471 domain-containing protein [Rhodoblastus sp.]
MVRWKRIVVTVGEKIGKARFTACRRAVRRHRRKYPVFWRRRHSGKGWEETKASITNKLSRGAFVTAFFLASLAKVGCKNIRLEKI